MVFVIILVTAMGCDEHVYDKVNVLFLELFSFAYYTTFFVTTTYLVYLHKP